MNMQPIDVIGASALAVHDIQAICRCLKLPLPTPDVSLSMIVSQANLTPTDVLNRLERSSDLSAKIAAAVLRGTVTVLPGDTRLTPKPYPKAPVKKPRTE